MQKNTPSKLKVTQLFITLFLVLVLVIMIAGYIYYGMQRAINSNNDVLVDNPVTESAPDGVATPELTEMEIRMQKLAEFTLQSSSTMTQAERMEVLESIEAESPERTLSDTQRVEILKTMNTEEETEI